MKTQKLGGRTSRAIWMVSGAAVNAALGIPAGVHLAHMIERGDQAEVAFAEWVELRERASAAERLIQHESSRRRGRASIYRLGMSGGSSILGERELFSIMAYFEVWGARAARGSVDPAKLSSYLGDASAHWLELLTELRDRSTLNPPLDGDRHEQLLHAITGAEIIANAGAQRFNALDWTPLRLLFERVSDDAPGESIYEATIHNPNDTSSPVPGLCIEFRDEAGARIGHWLVFPSDAAIPARSDIEIRGRVEWPSRGKPTALRFADALSDFYGADGLRDRFPGPGGTTRLRD